MTVKQWWHVTVAAHGCMSAVLGSQVRQTFQSCSSAQDVLPTRMLQKTLNRSGSRFSECGRKPLGTSVGEGTPWHEALFGDSRED